MNDVQSFDSSGVEEPAGRVILGVPWNCPAPLLLTAANLASALGVHLLCAFVDPSSYLVEWGPASDLPAVSLDPAVNDEAAYPAETVRRRVEHILAPTGVAWSFRVRNGSVGDALCRLADSVGASMFIVGGHRPGFLPRLGRVLEGSVGEALERSQHRPVVVVPPQRTSPRSGRPTPRSGG